MANEDALRLLCFIGFFLLFLLGEVIFPRKKSFIPKKKRWFGNMALIIISQALIPISLVEASVIFKDKGWVLLKDCPLVLEIVILDLAIYFQHRLFHKVDFFWRFHSIHHSDLELDTTSALRFHPGEILLSWGIKLILILIFGISALGIIIFEILLNTSSMFNHSNLKIPRFLENILRVFIVTPDFHRSHHSMRKNQLNKNFGFNLSLWDRVFKTYQKVSYEEQERIVLGLVKKRDIKDQRIWSLLKGPFY